MSQADFATKVLLVSRDYLSQLENGRQPSERLKQQVELLEKVGSVHPSDADSVGISRPSESRAPFPSESPAKAALRREFETLLSAAGEEPDRLGWIRVQMAEHLAPPKNWLTRDEINARAVQLAKKLGESQRGSESHRDTRRPGAASA
jgi:transcriptional regulator with XRE-family HTH domain